jgi:hypothetical protein
MDWVSCAGDINLPHDLPPTKKSSTIIKRIYVGLVLQTTMISVKMNDAKK